MLSLPEDVTRGVDVGDLLEGDEEESLVKIERAVEMLEKMRVGANDGSEPERRGTSTGREDSEGSSSLDSWIQKVRPYTSHL